MTSRVRRRRPRVPPRKGRQPLPQFGAGGDAVDWANFALGMLGITPVKKQRGGRLTDLGLTDIYAAMRGAKNSYRQRSGNLMKELMMASQPRNKPKPRTRSPNPRPKFTKQAAKAVAKRVAKKAAKQAATGALTAGASWATQKALDRI